MRYKMLSKKTWPSIRSSDEDAVRTILTEQNLIKDATFGKTKIFIQSPETLFHLVNFYFQNFQVCKFLGTPSAF
jgi:myosin-1